jgi:Rps23 Pro-64 3,4-dihydroxylase Tpa1-like proline 4-hydroxylase
MTTAELKINLINQITTLNNDTIVMQLKQYIDFELDKNIYKLSKAQNERILEAQKEYKEGKILSSEIANLEIEKWLKIN